MGYRLRNMESKMKIQVALAIALALTPLAASAQDEETAGGDDGSTGTQSSAADQGENASDISANAASDPNAIYIRWGESVEVLRGTQTVENINREGSEETVHGTTGDVTNSGGSVTYVPSGRPALACPSTAQAGIFGPCTLAQQG